MDLLDNLLGGRGCGTDGTLSRNPVTAMVDQIFDSHVATDEHGALLGTTTSDGVHGGYLYDGSAAVTTNSANVPADWLSDFGLYSEQGGAPLGTSIGATGFAGSNDRWASANSMPINDPSTSMMFQQQAMMNQMMQMQHMSMMMMSGAGPAMHQHHHQPQQQYHGQHKNYQTDLEGSAYLNHNDATEDDYYAATAEDYGAHDYDQAGTDRVAADFASAFGEGAGRAIEEVLQDGGNLTSEKLDEIFGSFGLSSAERTYEYEQTSARDWTEERARQHAGLTADEPSQSGYDQAWERVSERLEAGKNDYLFVQNNKYMSTVREENNICAESSSSQPQQWQPEEEKEETKRSDFEVGMELFEQGRIKEAILAFEADIQKQQQAEHSENADAWRMLGVCHAENDEDKKAIICLQKAVECDPFNVDALLALGTSYVNELDSVKALESLRLWVTHNPRFEGLKVEMDEYSDGTLMDEVVQLIMAAAAHAPDDADAQVVLGVLYNVSLDYDSAAECFLKVLDIRPDDYTLYNKLGATLANSNNSIEAIPNYAKAISIRPMYARGWLNLGISYANLNQYEEAAKGYLQALNLTPSAKHIWGYLRVVFTCMDRMDLAEMSGQEDPGLLAAEMGVSLIPPLEP